MRPWVAQRYTYVLADRFLRAFEYIQFAAGLPCSIKPPPAESGPGAPPRSGPLGVQPDEKCCPCRLILSEVQPSAFTDFQNKRPHSRDALRPSFADRSPSTNAEGAGKAGWPHAPGAPAQKEFARARKPQVQAVTTGLPCAVVYGLYELSPVNHPVCHRHQRDAQASSRTWRRTSGRQDHTISPSAKSPLVSQRLHVHRIPASRVVTIAIRPSASEAG